MTNSKELSFALEMCKTAGDLALAHFKRGVSVQMKDDNSPVTEADKEVELLIRKAIAANFPYDDILGEEQGQTMGYGHTANKGDNQHRKWIIDPIDGTYNFARGVPIFSVLLAMEKEGEVVLGVVCAPAMNEIFWAERGFGAYRNGERICVSQINNLETAQFNFGAPRRILDQGYWPGFTNLVAKTYRQRGFGDYLSFAYVFAGKAEIMLEVDLKPWDLAPMKIIAEEAGGRFSDLVGGESIYSGSCLITNGLLHEAALKLLLGQ